MATTLVDPSRAIKSAPCFKDHNLQTHIMATTLVDPSCAIKSTPCFKDHNLQLTQMMSCLQKTWTHLFEVIHTTQTLEVREI